MKTLGLDLGSNSLGWAILDDEIGEILDKGVIVFPEGVEADDKLETPAAKRRACRMSRRLKFRRKTRKWALLKILIEEGMCPMTLEELDAWKCRGQYPVKNKAFLAWLKSTIEKNPYADRAAAASGKVDPFVLGRALYHISQRRGFKSSRKDAANSADEEENAKKKKTDERSVVKSDIARLDTEIAAAGCKTLGQYFAKIIEDEGNNAARTRIRTRHTGRIEHYENEFAAIMDAQGIDYSPRKNRKEAPCLYEKLHTAIFYQRPLRSQKHLVGMCPLELSSPRCRISHPDYEEFRMLSFVNNLSFEKKDDPEVRIPLVDEDRALVCAQFMKASPEIKFGVISKAFAKRFKSDGLAFHYYRDDETVASCSMRHKIASAFGAVSYNEQKVFDALCFFDDDEKLRDWFRKNWPRLDDAQIDKLVKIHPKEGNANYSLKAIRKLLPFLRRGIQLFDALCLAKLGDFGLDEPTVESVRIAFAELKKKRAGLLEDRREGRLAKGQSVPTLLDMCLEYLRDHVFGDDKRKLEAFERYYHADATYAPETWYWKNKGKCEKVVLDTPRLPAVQLGMIRNPLVQRSMTVLRRLVNYLADHGKIDAETTIRIELARNVNDFATRHAIQKWQKIREEQRAKAKEFLGLNASDDAIDRYVLWEEQEHICLYTGQNIPQSALLTGNGFDIEHTIPRSRSGDDSLANKTLCDLTYNRQVKKGAIPTECPEWAEKISQNPVFKKWKENLAALEKNYRSQMNAAKGASDPERKSQARIKAIVTRLERDYWRDKIRRFEITADRLESGDGELGGFKKRQLVDTGIMSSHAVELLRCVYHKVFAVNGAATAFARKAWGVQTDEVKDRSSHTHHAKDAMVIAALTPGRFNAICSALKDDGTTARIRPCDVCHPPFEKFSEKVRKACDEILVKHVVRQTTLRQSSKRNCLAKAHKAKDTGKIVRAVFSQGDTVRGALHKDTFYGCIANPENGKKEFVVRKPLVGQQIAAALSMVDSIVDPAIREIVRSRLMVLKEEKKVVEAGDIVMPSGVPVNKVRIRTQLKNPPAVNNHAMVSKQGYKNPYYIVPAPGSNFRLAIYETIGTLSSAVENSLSWSKEHKKDDYVSPERKDGFKGFVYVGSMVIVRKCANEDVSAITASELRKRLYVTISLGGDGDARAQFKYAFEARQKKDMGGPSSKIDIDNPPALLRLGEKAYLKYMLFENIHFKMMLDGTIRFL